MKYFTGIDHPAIACDNVDTLVDWYVDVLGFSRFYHLEDRQIWIIQAPDGTYIEMMQKDEHERPERTVLTPGFSHLALRVNDLEKSIEYLDSQNVSWMGGTVPAIGGGNLRSFSDPEGNMLQIVQR